MSVAAIRDPGSQLDAREGSQSSLDHAGSASNDSDARALADSLRARAAADPVGFRQALQAALGEPDGSPLVDRLVRDFLSGELPSAAVLFVEAGSLGDNALGAYSHEQGGTIYLDRQLLDNPAQLERVFAEEMGHHLDALSGKPDARGDEGAIFSRSLFDGPIGSTEQSELRAENDTGLIVINGRDVLVEFMMGGSPGPGEGSMDAAASSSQGTGSTGPGPGEGSMDAAASSSQGSGDHGPGPGEGSMDAAAASAQGSGDGSPGPGEGSMDAASASAQGVPDSGDDNGNSGLSGDSGSGSDSDADGSFRSGERQGSDTDSDPDPVEASVVPASATEPEPTEQRGGWFSRALDSVQTALDFAGFVPGFGVAADVINGGISLARGDYVGAALNFSAAVPGVGDGLKASSMAARAANRGADARRGADAVDDVVDYSRPSGFRKGVREEVWDNAVEPSTGRVRDPVTGRFMSKDEAWDMGHRPGHEFHKHQQSARDRGISRKDFLDEHNNPDNFRPELPSSNRSHRGEDRTDTYFGM